jgi:hypothetical protein
MLREKIRTVFSFHLALVSILVLWVYVGSEDAIWDADIWWHMRNAQYLLAHLKFPQVDTYSFTVAGSPWMNHEWLAEIPYLLAWRAGGLVGIFVLFLGLLEVNLLGIFYLACKGSGNLKGSFLVTCFAMYLTVVSFGPRTILFGYIYLIFLILLLRRYRAKGQAPLWLIPPLFCLWINTHGSWLLGMIIFGIMIAAGLVEGQWGRVEAERWSPAQLRRLLITLGASLVALFVNPFGYRLVMYPFDLVFRQKLNIAVIDEWASVDFHDSRGKVVLILLAAVLLGALFSRIRWKLEELALAAFALYAGLMHIRFLFLAAILLVPLLARMLDFLPPYEPEIDKPLLNAMIFGGVLMIMIARFPSGAALDQVVANRFPANALTFVKSHGLPGRVFNRYMWGGYLIWYCPEVKTFIDSRTDIFEYAGVLKDYMDVETLKNPLGVLDKYQIRYVLLPADSPVAYLLKNHVNWSVIFSDHVSMIFERVSPSPAGASTQLEEPRKNP